MNNKPANVSEILLRVNYMYVYVFMFEEANYETSSAPSLLRKIWSEY